MVYDTWLLNFSLLWDENSPLLLVFVPKPSVSDLNASFGFP